jgi:hypothetical protein
MPWRSWRATTRVRRLGSVRAWRCAHRRQQAKLRSARWWHARRVQIDKQRMTFGVDASLARQSVWPATTAVVLLVLTEWVGRHLTHVRRFRIDLLSQTLEPDKYATLAGTAVAAEATLLALFFATVGVVASTTYSSVPAAIRDLFIEERTHTIYTRGIARALVFTTALLALGAAGYHARVLSVAVAAVLAIVGVQRLLAIGARTFRYFDPASLTEGLPGRFQRALTRATSQPKGGGNMASQQGAHDDAETVLNHYRRITDLLTSRPVPNSDAPVEVAGQLLDLNIHYGPAKNRIPTSSSWWSRAVRYSNWLTLDTTELDVALATSTGIPGRELIDLNWVERQSAADIGQLLTVATSDNINAVTEVLDRASTHIRHLGRLLQIDEAVIFEDQLVSTIRSCIYDEATTNAYDESTTSDDVDLQGSRDRVNAAQRSVRLLTDAWLGLVEAATRVGQEDLAVLIDRALNRRSANHVGDFGRPVRQVIEDVLEWRHMEKNTEGRPITPSWWVRHEVARTLLTHILDAFNAIQHRLSSRTSEAVQEAMERRQWSIAAMIGLASLELDNAITTDLTTIKAVAAKLETLRSQAIDDSRWPKPAQTLLEPDADLRPLLLRQLSQCFHHLGARPHDPTRPDLFGQLHRVLSDAAFDAIINANHPVANTLCGALFQQMGPTAARLTTDLAGQTINARIIYGQEPIMAMMELSGYAIIMNELDGDGVWGTLRQLWDGLRSLRGHTLLRRLVELADRSDSIFVGLSHVDLTREVRRQRLAKLLHDRGITGGAPPPGHLSPIVAAYAGLGVAGPWRVTDLFLVHYIAPQLDDESILPPSAKSLAATLARDEDLASDSAHTADKTTENIDQPHGLVRRRRVRRRVLAILDAISGRQSRRPR